MHGITVWIEHLIEIEIAIPGIGSDEQGVFGIGAGEVMTNEWSGMLGGQGTDQ